VAVEEDRKDKGIASKLKQSETDFQQRMKILKVSGGGRGEAQRSKKEFSKTDIFRSPKVSIFEEKDDTFEEFQERPSQDEFRSASKELSRELSFKNRFSPAKKEQRPEVDSQAGNSKVRKKPSLILKKSLDITPRNSQGLQGGNFFVKNGFKGLNSQDKDSSRINSRPKIPKDIIKGELSREINLSINNMKGLKSQISKFEDMDLASRNEGRRLEKPQPFKVFADRKHQTSANKEALGQSSLGFKFLRSGTKKQDSKVSLA
jgi:hypothetical protein